MLTPTAPGGLDFCTGYTIKIPKSWTISLYFLFTKWKEKGIFVTNQQQQQQYIFLGQVRDNIQRLKEVTIQCSYLLRYMVQGISFNTQEASSTTYICLIPSLFHQLIISSTNCQQLFMETRSMITFFWVYLCCVEMDKLQCDIKKYANFKGAKHQHS